MREALEKPMQQLKSRVYTKVAVLFRVVSFEFENKHFCLPVREKIAPKQHDSLRHASEGVLATHED
jgi:hypothetical protein